MVSHPDQRPESGANSQCDENRTACFAFSRAGFATARLRSLLRFHDLPRFCSPIERLDPGADSERSRRMDVPRTSSEKIEPIQPPELRKVSRLSPSSPLARECEPAAISRLWVLQGSAPSRNRRPGEDPVDSQSAPVTRLWELQRVTNSCSPCGTRGLGGNCATN